MKPTNFALLVVAGLSLIAGATAAHAALIDSSTITASDGTVGTLTNYNIADVLNGREADLTTDLGAGDPGDLMDLDSDTNIEHQIHTTTNSTGWLSDASGNFTGDPYIQFDLGTSYVVDALHLWGFVDETNTNNNEQHTIKAGNILVSDSADFTSYTTAFSGTLIPSSPANVANGVILEMGDAGTYIVDLTSIDGDLRTGRFVRIEVDSTHRSGGISRVALGEIEFYGEAFVAPPIPEPGSLALVGLGLTLLVGPGRRGRPNRP